MHHLVIERHEDRQADGDTLGAGGGEAAGAHHRIVEHRERQERLRRPQHPPDECRTDDDRRNDQTDDLLRQPRIARAAPGQRQKQRHRGGHHQRGAGEIDLVGAFVDRHAFELPVGQHRRRQGERHVEPKNHRPVQMLGDDAAEHRAGGAGDDPDRTGIGLVIAALARRHRVGDDRLGQRHDAAAADALQAAAEDQHQHARRGGAGGRARHEHAERHQHHAAPAVNVAELAVERRDHGRGQQISDHHPGQILEIVEGAADGRQRRRHDGLVQRAEEHRQRQAADDGDDFAPAELALGGAMAAGIRRDAFDVPSPLRGRLAGFAYFLCFGDAMTETTPPR